MLNCDCNEAIVLINPVGTQRAQQKEKSETYYSIPSQNKSRSKVQQTKIKQQQNDTNSHKKMLREKENLK